MGREGSGGLVLCGLRTLLRESIRSGEYGMCEDPGSEEDRKGSQAEG